MAGDDDEIRELATALRAHAAWETELSGSGWPVVAAPVSGRRGAVDALIAAVTADDIAPKAAASVAAVRPVAPIAPVTPAQGPIVVPTGERAVVLAALAEQASDCTRCARHASRTRGVFARGNPDATLVFVGEGPSADDDRAGEPFAGPAGELLDKMIGAMGFARDAVYLCQVMKCRSATARSASPAEAAACEPFYVAQLEALRPKVIVALGRGAAEALGGATTERGDWRGIWSAWRGVPLIATHAPAEVLHSAELKRPVWSDLQAVMAKLGVSR